MRIALRSSVLIFACLALATFCPAEDAGTAAKRPLPDAAKLLTELQQNQKQLDQKRKDYICVDDEQEIELDKRGATKKTERRQYEVYYVAGAPIRKLLSKEGVPLSESEKRKEDERVVKQEKNAREHQAKMDRGERDKDEISVMTFLQSSRFTNIRREQYHGLEVIAMDFEPNPDFRPSNRAESVANKLAGTVWIDEDGHQVARLEARMLKSQSFGLGLASLKEGSAFMVEQKKINEELWLPSANDISISARVVFGGMNKRFVNNYSNYRRFKTDTRIIGVEEIKQ